MAELGQRACHVRRFDPLILNDFIMKSYEEIIRATAALDWRIRTHMPENYMEEIFADQNDINEDTRMQLELINQTLAELQVHQKLSDKPRRPIGFIRQEED